jgi:hypothetical protein
MVVIQCPHCEEDVELKDGAFGLFDCPHCDEEFSWGSPSKWSLDNFVKWGYISGLALFIFGIISAISLWATEGIRNCEPPGFLDFDVFDCGGGFLSFLLFGFFSVCILLPPAIVSACRKIIREIKKYST